jgi:4-amino-4-deoxy-L-arabinose transferase-like glycosyltransferase
MVIVAATPLFMAFARIVIFDMLLALCVSAAILAAYLAEEREGPRRRHWYLAATLAAGLATLVKGPVGFLVPLLVMTVFHLVTGRRDAIQRFFAPAHIGLFLLVVLPWFVGLSLACPDFPYYGIMQESIARFTTPAFRRTQPFYYYALIIAGCFFAWSMLLPGALRLAFRARTRLCRADQLFMVWALVVILFFSLSQSKLPGYILTGVVALGVLTARVFAAALSGRNDAALAMVRRSCVGLALASGLLAAPIVALIIAPLASPKPRWLTAEGLAWFGPLLPGLVITLGSVAALALLAAATRRAQLALLAFLSFPVLLLTLNFELIPRHASQKSARGLFEQLPAGLPANTEFACLGCLPHGLPFYLGRLVTVFSEDGGELTSNYVLFALGSGQPWPERLVPFTDLDRYLASRAGPVFLLARGPRRATLASLAPAGAAILTFNNDYVGTLLPARAP